MPLMRVRMPRDEDRTRQVPFRARSNATCIGAVCEKRAVRRELHACSNSFLVCQPAVSALDSASSRRTRARVWSCLEL
eukprot:15127-Chlamydomonas_euryale.AAC.3